MSKPALDPEPYMTMQEAAVFLRYSTAGAARRFFQQAGIPLATVGRRLLVKRTRVEHYLETGDNGQQQQIRDRKKAARHL